MDDVPVLYSFPMSRGRMAQWTLEELGVPYRLEIVNIPRNDQKRPEFLAVNAMGKIPALVHRGAVITEAAAICLYLADAFPGAGLAPALDDPLRGPYLRWMFFTASGYESAVLDIIAPRIDPPPSDAIGHGTPEQFLAVMEGALRPGPWILGERFSVVDICAASQISYSILMKRIEATPVLADYVERAEARPAHKRMAAHCDQMLEELEMPPISYPA